MLTELAELVNDTIKHQYPDSKHDLKLIGHFNSDIFKPDKMFFHHGVGLLRLFAQMAENMTEKDYLEFFKKLAKRIHDEVNDKNQFDT